MWCFQKCYILCRHRILSALYLFDHKSDFRYINPTVEREITLNCLPSYRLLLHFYSAQGTIISVFFKILILFPGNGVFITMPVTSNQRHGFTWFKWSCSSQHLFLSMVLKLLDVCRILHETPSQILLLSSVSGQYM